MVRRAAIIAISLSLLPACVAAQEAAPLEARIASAIERAAQFLRDKQQPDGAWRSETYGAMRDGPSLTPHVATGSDILSHFAVTKATMYRDGGTIKLDGILGVELGAHIRYDGAMGSKTRGQFFISTQIGQPTRSSLAFARYCTPWGLMRSTASHQSRCSS